jgi:A/G-specific adenine glycosylase
MKDNPSLTPGFQVRRCGALLSRETVLHFRAFIHRFYNRHGRDFPWRKTRDPYRILVSEVMLQQTQVDRVSKKYGPFLERFPDIHTLDDAPLQEVLGEWRGLGYNRRCVALKRSARVIVEQHGGRVPDRIEDLLALPGVGPATAAGVLCFAFNTPAPYLETNIRNTFIHLFFQDRDEVHDREILPLLEQSMDRENPREWFYALMDYGVVLKKKVGGLNDRSSHYVKQPTFEGSDRQLRGRILALLLERPLLTEQEVRTALSEGGVRVSRILKDLTREGFVAGCGSRFRISD